MNNESMKKTFVSMAVFGAVCQQLKAAPLVKIAAALTVGFFVCAKYVEPQLLKTTPLPDEQLLSKSLMTAAVGTMLHMDGVKQKIHAMGNDKKADPNTPVVWDNKAVMTHSAAFGASLMFVDYFKANFLKK